MLRAGRPTDLGIAVSTIAVLAILVIFVFPLFSRSDEPAGPRNATTAAVYLQQELQQEPVEDSGRQSLVETSLGLTLILGVALLAMAVGSRGRPG